MVRAILDGRKTVTRRILGPKFAVYVTDTAPNVASSLVRRDADGDPCDGETRCPYGVVGDRLWVRETWAPEPGYEASHDAPEHDGGGGQPGRVVYRADERPSRGACPGLSHAVKRWRPSIFMPRWACRLVLDVVDVRVERLHAITPQDVAREGADVVLESLPPQGDVAWFAKLWDSLNAKRAAWASNPWVWRIEFRRVL